MSRPPTLPDQIHGVLDATGGRYTSLFRLAYVELGCSYTGLISALQRMERQNQVHIVRSGCGRPITIIRERRHE